MTQHSAYLLGVRERDKSITACPFIGPPFRDRWLEGWSGKTEGALRG